MCSRGVAVAVADQRAHEGDRLLRLLGGRRAAGADRPDRLVGDHDERQQAVLDLGEVDLHLLAQLALRLAGVALLLGLADAQDRRQPRLERRGHLALQRAVRLAEVLARARSGRARPR